MKLHSLLQSLGHHELLVSVWCIHDPAEVGMAAASQTVPALLFVCTPAISIVEGALKGSVYVTSRKLKTSSAKTNRQG